MHLRDDNHRTAITAVVFFNHLKRVRPRTFRRAADSLFHNQSEFPFLLLQSDLMVGVSGVKKSSEPWVIMWCVSVCLVFVTNSFAQTKRGYFFRSRLYLELSLTAQIPDDGTFVTLTTIDNFVISSTKQAFLISTINPKKCKKSAPIIGLSTAAITKDHLNARRKPTSNEIIFSPYVLIIDPFAANNVKLLSYFTDRLWWRLAGHTEKSAPVSTKNVILVFIIDKKTTGHTFSPICCLNSRTI